MTYYFVGEPEFSDWYDIITNHPLVGYSKEPPLEGSVIPLRPEQHHFRGSVFPRNTDEQYQTFANKAKFALYMMQHFPKSIPVTYYYRDGNTRYTNPEWKGDTGKCIIKPTKGYGALGIHVTNSFDAFRMIKNLPGQSDRSDRLGRNIVISEFIPHRSYWVGHFLTINGMIIYRIYFTSESKGLIKRGKIVNYQTVRPGFVPFDEEVFFQLFKKTGYSGITCSDFMVKDGQPLLFEVNPRPGGSLMHDKPVFNEMIQSLIGAHGCGNAEGIPTSLRP